MRGIAQFAMRGRMQAVMSVTVLAMLSLLLAPLSILSGAAVALVSLRQGPRDGMLVITMSTVASGVLSYLLFSDILPAIVFALVVWMPVWVLALILRWSRSLALSLQAGVLMTLLLAGLFYLAVPQPADYWYELLREPMQQLLANSQLSETGQDMDQITASLAEWITAVMSAGFFLQLVAILLIGRWWQALLFNPGGFGQEFRELKFSRLMAIVAAPFFLWLILSQPPEWVLTLGLVMLSAYFIQGLAVTHGLLQTVKANTVWLIGIYVLLFIAMPYMMTALAMTGFTDTWFNFRKRRESANN